MIRDRQSQPVRYRELPPGSGLRKEMAVERERLIADGWQADEIERWAFCFCARGGERLCIEIEHFEPGTVPISRTERAENAERIVRNAITASAKLEVRNIKVFASGSYRNRTNIRRESDVDVGVLCYDSFFGVYPQGTTRETFGNVPATYFYKQFKAEVREALKDYFDAGAAIRGSKAFDIKATSHHVEADVAPFYEHRRYSPDGTFLSGVELRPDTGPAIINWPEQHYANGNAKNDRTKRS